MKNSNLAKRIATCVIGIPLLGAVIFLFPKKNFIGLSILVMLISLLGSFETSKILFGEEIPFACITWLPLLMQYLNSDASSEYFFVFILLAGLFIEIKAGEKDDFKGSIDRIAKTVLLTVYPSYFLLYIIRFVSLPVVNSYTILLYLLLVFSNDIFAYVFGMLFGKNNAGCFKASPKKSKAGFIGGFISCIGICFLFTYLFADKLVVSFDYADKLMMGICVSLFSNAGDLAESVLKRSAGVKDSGNIIPGRGGILDCIDSICASAPFIFFIFRDMIK